MMIRLHLAQMLEPDVFVLDTEYDPLADLVCSSPHPTPGLALLWHELDRAKIIHDEGAPETFARMGCQLTVHDLTSDEVFKVRLVYPTEATGPGLVSVTSRLGAALIGLPIGEDFRWTPADGRDRVIRILSVASPPPPCKQRSFESLLNRG
jgi:regulator of nucleoside diphosphate kinase